jgi:hypothetical protein
VIGAQGNYEVWEENWQAVEIFLCLRTQWVQGFGGPVGLNYAAIQPTLDLMGVVPDEKSEFFLQLQILEDAALETIYSKVKSK